MIQGNTVEINCTCHSSLSFFPQKPAVGRAPVLPLHDSDTMAGVLRHLLLGISISLFFFFFSKRPDLHQQKSHFVPALNPVPRASTEPSSSAGGSVNQMPASFGWVAVPWPQEAAVGKVPHFSSYWVSCCGSLSLRIVTDSKDTFIAMAAQPGLECSQCLSTGMEKQPCCAKMHQGGLAS